jgi:NADPH2:quinone reductase
MASIQTSMQAIRIHETGGPEVMRLGEVLIKIAAAGINYADLAQRQGTYLTRTRTPMILGFEAAGTVAALGPGVTSPTVGTQVSAFVSGAYAEYAVAGASSIIPIPESLDFASAAAFPVQGLTAYQILRDSGRLQQGESVLVHAAAGGVGTLAVQIARLLGAGKVIGTASNAEKLDLVRSLGADAAINYTQDDWVAQVKQATDGKGVDIVLEMVGGKIAEQSLNCLAPFGRMVVFGAASGDPLRLTATQLMYKNLSVTGYWLSAMLNYPEHMVPAITGLMQYLAQGKLQIVVGQTFPLAEAAAAHQAIANRTTTGKVVLLANN